MSTKKRIMKSTDMEAAHDSHGSGHLIQRELLSIGLLSTVGWFIEPP